MSVNVKGKYIVKKEKQINIYDKYFDLQNKWNEIQCIILEKVRKIRDFFIIKQLNEVYPKHLGVIKYLFDIKKVSSHISYNI